MHSWTAQVESLGEGDPGGAASVSRLHMVDLAGSERQARTGAAGQRLREAGAINSALTVLRRVVAARCERARRTAHSVPPGGAPVARPELCLRCDAWLSLAMPSALLASCTSHQGLHTWPLDSHVPAEGSTVWQCPAAGAGSACSTET